jgi:hypothetical protein
MEAQIADLSTRMPRMEADLTEIKYLLGNQMERTTALEEMAHPH